jgi:hypothetical protein
VKAPDGLRAEAAKLYERARKPAPTEDPLTLALQAMALEHEADELERKTASVPAAQHQGQQQQQIRPKKEPDG